jgi:hypothetical protein
VVKRLGLLTVLAACGSFEDPTIVIDNRILAVRGEPVEQVFELDLADPPDDIDELKLVDSEICALIADPAEDRRLEWTMRLCAPSGPGRCTHDERPYLEFGEGVIDDPETSATPQVACATLEHDAGFLLILQDSIQRDELFGFSGIDVNVSLEVRPEGADEAEWLYAEKDLRYAARMPEDREANINPTLERIDIEVEDADPIPLPLGRCAEQAQPLRIAPGEQLPLLPVEPEGAREDYVVPTFDGGSRMFTETIDYQWLASAGSWTRGSTGGPRDLSGMLPPLDSKWTAPDDVTEELDVSIWVIQRDERLGLTWYESCVRVTPPAE